MNFLKAPCLSKISGLLESESLTSHENNNNVPEWPVKIWHKRHLKKQIYIAQLLVNLATKPFHIYTGISNSWHNNGKFFSTEDRIRDL